MRKNDQAEEELDDEATTEGGEAAAPSRGKGAAKKAVKKKAAKKRVGKLVKPEKNKPANIAPGQRAEARFRPDIYAEDRLDAWWLNGSSTYFVRQKGASEGKDAWKELNAGQLEKTLCSLGLDDEPPKGETLSEVDRVLLYIRDNRIVELSMNIAGYDAGVYDMGDSKVLVRKSARWIEPVQGKWDTLEQVFEGLFTRALDNGEQPRNFLGYLDSELTRDRGRQKAREIWKLMVRERDGDLGWCMDQRVIFYSWLKLRMQVYLTNRKEGEALHRNAQVLVLAGPRKAGKGFLQNLVLTPLLGCRVGDPSDVLFGRSNFNKDLFSSEHLALEEMPTNTATKDRLYFGEMLKAYITRMWQKFHPKGKDGIMLTPVWTWSISVNDDPERLRAFPPIAGDIADKLHMLHVSSSPMPVDTTTHQAYEGFAKKVHAELPGFLWWLVNEFEIPPVLLDGRFGMHAFHAPELVQSLFEDTPAGSLLELIEDSRFGSDELPTTLWGHESDPKPAFVRKRFPQLAAASDQEIKDRVWCGSAALLQKYLEAEDNTQHRAARDLFKHNRPPRLLGRLEKEEPTRVQYERRNNARMWYITRAFVDEPAAVTAAVDDVGF